MNDEVKIYLDDARNILRAAKLLDAEGQTWMDGWAVNGVWPNNKEDEWAHIRWIHLTTAANNLKAMAARYTKPQKVAEPSGTP